MANDKNDSERGPEIERDADFSVFDRDQSEGAQAAAANQAQGEIGSSELRAELEEFKDKYLRTMAELDNYRKRTLKERSELLKYQGEKVFYDLLEIADNFELALQHAEADPAKLKTGVEMIHKMLKDLMSRWEVRGDSGVGQKFDPFRHNAISKVPRGDNDPGIVVNELKKAYFYKDKLIRPAEVVVSDSEQSASESQAGDGEQEQG